VTQPAYSLLTACLQPAYSLLTACLQPAHSYYGQCSTQVPRATREATGTANKACSRASSCTCKAVLCLSTTRLPHCDDARQMEKCPPNDGKRYAFTRAIDLLLADKQEIRKGAAHMARLQIPPGTPGCASRGADSPRSPLRQLAGPHANRSNILEHKAQESCPTNHKQSFFPE